MPQGPMAVRLVSFEFIKAESVADKEWIEVLRARLAMAAEWARHARIADFVDGMIFGIGIEILRVDLRVLHHRQGAEDSMTGGEEEDHRISVVVAYQSGS